MENLTNYLALRDRVDARCRAIQAIHAASIVCRKGCDACCRHLNLFPVEAAALALAMARLPEARASAIRLRIEKFGDDPGCPLLIDGGCALYKARPLICRTHGLPILMDRDGRLEVDVCPKNFKDTTIDKDALIDLEALNTVLVAVNTLFVQTVWPHAALDWRPSIAEALAQKGVEPTP
ncbi:MAG: YkgJ family cysteine cluster protein [Desulfobacterales bacterium]|nr:YkgJ family cysteine cluster protein [Desulfobacterales bacterium]